MKGNKLRDKYLNTVHYTDKCLGEYFEAVKKKSWYNKTVFILMADHAHRLPENRQSYEQRRHWIPFVLFGPALKKQMVATINEKIASQTDFPNFLLAQLGLNNQMFHWGKDFSDPYSPDYALYTFEDGFGLVQKEQSIVFDNTSRKMICLKNPAYSDSLTTKMLKQGQAYLQKLTREFYDLSD